MERKFIDKDERIIEARLSAEVEWQILGFHSGAKQEFVILGTGFHKGKVYTPPDIKNTVIKRKKEIEAELEKKAPSCGRPK